MPLDSHSGDPRHRGELLEQHPDPVHLVVTDGAMPRMDGRQRAEVLSVRRPGIKVLYTSGYTDDAVVGHGVQQAEVAFLRKPFTPTILLRKIRQLLDAG